MMGSPPKLFAVTLFCSAFTVVQIYGELIMLKYPYEYGATERNYTCITEDDGASIIWYDSSGSDWSELEDSTSRRPASGNVRDCAIRGESKCLAKWAKTSDWRVVNSASKPRGPVFDYRFSDLTQFQSHDEPRDNRYGSPDAPRYDEEEKFERLMELGQIYHENGEIEYYGTPRPRPYESTIDFRNEWWNSVQVGEVNKSSSTVWFSGRELNGGDFGILLCRQDSIWRDFEQDKCLWVKTFEHEINVRSCPSGAFTLGDELRVSKCNSPSEVVSAWNFGTNTWMTYRLEWDTRQETIKIFKGNDFEPLVEGTMPSWDTVSDIRVTMRYTGPRLRFHFYDYHFTDTKNSIISTRAILHYGEIFCAELMVSLCPKCKINVTLVNQYGAGIETWPFSGDERDPYNGLLGWQLVKVNTRFDTDIPRHLSLKIESILDGDVGRGEWAIDNFRICETDGYHSSGKMKESRRTFSNRVTAVCQKLSLANNPVVESNTYNFNRNSELLSELQKFLRSQSGPLVGKGGYIIGQSGYICDRGFTGNDCSVECDYGFYGFECTQNCGFCSNFGSCNKSTGFCDAGCNGNMIGPFCKTVFVAPIVEDVEDTTATVLQSLLLDEEEVLNKIEVQIREAGGESWTNFTARLRDPETLSIYAAHITDLKPNTVYTARATVSIETYLTFGPEYNLTTRLGTNTPKYTTPGFKSNLTCETTSTPVHQDQTEAPTVVNVTTSSAKIIQKVKPAGYDGQIFVFFILRELSSNTSFAVLPTNKTALEYELDAKNLKPNALYKVYTLFTLLEPDPAVILDSSPIIFKTKCLDEINFEVTQSQRGLTINMLSRPENCDHPANQEYTVVFYDIAYNRRIRPPPVSKFPRSLSLSSDTEYEVKIWIGRRKDRRLVFTTTIRTSAAEEVSYDDY